MPCNDGRMNARGSQVLLYVKPDLGASEMNHSWLLILLVMMLLAGCSHSVDSCLNDGITLEQVQEYLEQGKRQELVNMAEGFLLLLKKSQSLLKEVQDH